MNEYNIIGQGATADIIEWSDGSCLKLFKHGCEDNARKEFHVAQQIMTTPLRIAKPLQLIDYQGRSGIVYERIHGAALGAIMMKNPSHITAWAHHFAQLHYQIHQLTPPDLPSPAAQLHDFIQGSHLLTDAQKDQLLTFITSQTDVHALCHFDFHPLNVIRADEGQDVIIDWNNGKVYHPLADVALTTIVLSVSGFPKQFAQPFCKSYIEAYLQLSQFDPLSLRYWQIAAAIARANEKKAHESAAIEQIIEHQLQLLRM